MTLQCPGVGGRGRSPLIIIYTYIYKSIYIYILLYIHIIIYTYIYIYDFIYKLYIISGLSLQISLSTS